MLNDGWDEGMTAAESDTAAEEIYRDAHPCCLECEEPGCLTEDCPSAFCEAEALVTCMGELVHAGCVERFEAHIENKCTGDVCHCGAPEHVEEDASAKTLVEPYESTATVSAGWLARLAQAAAVVSLLLAAVAAEGCAAHAQPVEVESVGQLTAGPSVRSAPVAHDEPPQLGEIVDTGSDDAGSVVETTTRVEADASVDAAPEVVAKTGGLTVGSVR